MKTSIAAYTILVLIIYYIVLLFSLLNLHSFSFFAKKSLPLLSQTEIRKLLDDKDLSLSMEKRNIIAFFFRGDPEILSSLCKYDTRKNPINAEETCHEAQRLDSQNISTFKEYLSILFSQNSPKVVANKLREFSLIEDGEDLPFTHPSILQLLSPIFFMAMPTQATKVSEYKSQLYYLLGLSVMDNHPKITEQFWTAARNLSPDWGYFHEELASLHYYILGDKQKSREILIACQRNKFAAEQCIIDRNQIHIPGFYKNQIEEIPVLIPS